MRIFFLGDPQYSFHDLLSLKRVGRDIASTHPDLTVVMGDYGPDRAQGTGKGFGKVVRMMGPFPEDTVFLLGNHDVQGEAGERYVRRGTVGRRYERAFGKRPENSFLEFDDFRVFLVNLDIQPVCHYSTKEECFVSEKHFHQIETKIQERPGVPVVMVTHAPPVGTDLVTLPDKHLRACNAYMDQSSLPERWMRLYREHREIVLWFSGHYHIGHDVPGTIAYSGHTVFVLIGVPTSKSLLGGRHSRVLDILPDEVRISTYDHGKHVLLDEPDYVHKGPLCALMEENYSESDTFKAGKGRLIAAVAGGGDRIYALTEGNFVWEIVPSLRATMGTLSNKGFPEVLALEAGKEHIWLYTEETRYGIRYSTPRRFRNGGRVPDMAKETYGGVLPLKQTGIVTLDDGSRYEVFNVTSDDRLRVKRL